MLLLFYDPNPHVSKWSTSMLPAGPLRILFAWRSFSVPASGSSSLRVRACGPACGALADRLGVASVLAPVASA